MSTGFVGFVHASVQSSVVQVSAAFSMLLVWFIVACDICMVNTVWTKCISCVKMHVLL